MSEIDWSKAPEGATHYNSDNGLFYKVEDEEVYYRTREDDWLASAHRVYDFVKYSAAIPRPTKQEWDGEGVPPVGVECEYQLKHDEPHEWSRCVIEFIGDRHIVARSWPDETMPEFEQCFKKREVKFRPLKSQHERQREELERIIEDHLERRGSFWTPRESAEVILSHYNLEPKQ